MGDFKQSKGPRVDPARNAAWSSNLANDLTTLWAVIFSCQPGFYAVVTENMAMGAANVVRHVAVIERFQADSAHLVIFVLGC
jgi:hypothetical protein